VTLRRSMQIDNDSSNLSRVRTTVSEVLDRSPFDSNMRNKIIVAVDEALANVVEHAYAGGSGVIDISFELDERQLEVKIRDKGEKFDPGERLQSTLDIHKHIKLGLKGGLGLFLMRQIMDEVRFNEASDDFTNELVLVKRLPGAEPAPEQG